MKRSLLFCLFLLAVLLAISGCGILETGAKKAPHLDSEYPSYRITDRNTIRSLADGIAELLKEGKATDRKTLIEQLDRKHYALALPNAPTEKISPVDIYEKYKNSVLVIGTRYKCRKCKKWHAAGAAGFFITNSGVAVTNYHVIDNLKGETLVAMTTDGKVYAVKEVLAANKEEDIAVLQIDGSGFTPLALSPDNPVGTLVTVISHPASRFYTLTQGIVSRYSIHKRDKTEFTRMTITADFARGSSGAPVINEYGGVVGMVSTTYSIYYEKKKGRAEILQMVIKECVPARSILNLLTDETEAE